MSGRRFFGTVIAAGLVLALLASLVSAQDFGPQGDAGMLAPLGTAFTYQGQLRSGDAPVNGACDLQFSLYDAASAGAQIGTTQTKTNVAVSGGYFTIAPLDFGAAAFQGDGRWLAIAVRCPAGSGSYVTLSPRQALTAAPYALYAKGAPWTGLSGVPAGFADGVDNNTTYTAGTGLTLSGTTFAADTAVLQRRVSGTCGSGNAIRVVNADGTVTCQAVDVNAWQLTGNAGTTPGTHYLGTSDNQALELKVNGARVLRLEPNSTSPNLIGGYSGNWVITGAFGVTIGGGGTSNAVNWVTDAYGTVGGGIGNQAGDNMGTVTDSENATVGGGAVNRACADGATVGGGYDNCASADNATVAGGSHNTASADNATVAGGYNNTASAILATIGGGYFNLAADYYATVGGGHSNYAAAEYATIAGGGPSDLSNTSDTNNRVTDDYGTVGGGGGNWAGNRDGDTTNARGAAVGGGLNNTASGIFATTGGGFNNVASAGIATVAGGSHNTASAVGATIAGGSTNTASANYSTVAGGALNTAAANYATIAGGGPSDLSNPGDTNNRVTDDYGTVGGGGWNWVGNGDVYTTNARFATVGGGHSNRASAEHATIAGGHLNAASAESATIGGGYRNCALADYATIAGGGPSDLSNPSNTNNRVTDDYGTVGGGAWNWAGNGDGDTTNAPFATIGGGHENIASGWSATVGGGYSNDASGASTTVGGGWNNTASGNAATVPGGATNIASGAYSFAAGAHAQATHAGSFVWASVEAASSWGNDTFTVRSHGGARFYTAPGTATGVQLASGGGSWSSLSDRAAKENYEVVDTREVVEWLAAIPIQTWNYKSQDPTIRHIGPVAQDFYAAFGVGEDDTHISTVDADGVALAAIQGLYQLSQEQNAHIAELEQENAALHSELDSLEARLSALERQSGRPAAATRPWPISGLALGGLTLLGVVAFSRRREGGLR